jgi:hypothetical protein
MLKEEETLEQFMKENIGNSETFGLYKLKTRILHEKLSRI